MIKRLLSILLLATMLPATLLAYGASLPEYYGNSYYAELPALCEKLKTTQGKKIVIVGGSNIAFGVNSAQMEYTLGNQGFDYTVCNFGLYAAVGTSAMLALSEAFIGQGDIVVLAIEPTNETFSTYFGATAMLKCAESHPEMLLHMNKTQASSLIGNYLGYLQERAQIRRTGLLPQPEGAYARSSFNANGDMVYPRGGNAILLGYDPATPIDFASVTPEPAFSQQVNDYIAAAEKKGATVMMSFSPMNRGAVTDLSEEVLYDFFCRLQETFRCQIISDPNDYIMESGWFYDSNYNLNDAGSKIRTYQLTCDILHFLECYEDIPFQAPSMPASIAQVEDDAVSGDFLFEPLGEKGLVVSGLTESGKTKSSLTVPAAQNGKAVVGISADAFAGNTVLTTLTLPSSITSIPDGAFDGCVNLTRLNLLHTSTTPTVGQGLFSGADKLYVYVPSSAYHLYRDGAGCAASPWEDHLSRVRGY